MKRGMILALALLAGSSADAGYNAPTFDDLGLPPESSINNAGPTGSFIVGGNSFNNSYDPTYGAWYGWAISNTTDTTTPGYLNYSAITGTGSDGTSTYAVGYTFGTPATDNPPNDPSSNPFHPSDTYITLAAGTAPVSIDITNTTYTYLSLLDGDPYGFSKPFGPGDFQTLDIRGYDASGNQTGDVIVPLADYTNGNSFLLNSWETVSLTSLGRATTLQFGIVSSRNDSTYGVETPTYFAADNFVTTTAAAVVPEPASLVLTAMGLVGLIAFGRNRRRAADSSSP